MALEQILELAELGPAELGPALNKGWRKKG